MKSLRQKVEKIRNKCFLPPLRPAAGFRQKRGEREGGGREKGKGEKWLGEENNVDSSAGLKKQNSTITGV